MLNPKTTAAVLGLTAALTGGLWFGGSHEPPAGITVQLCDGETEVATAPGAKSREEGAAIAAQLMARWQAKHRDQAWVMQEAESAVQSPAQGQDGEALLDQRFQLLPPFDNRVLLGDGQASGHPYRNIQERDIVLWERETKKLVLEGAQVFHDAGRLGSTIAVSCDMCHPDASNTHPETYPKYQTQLGKAVLLRDMINWCIQHPVRGQALAADDPRMVALEAYIYAQRSGKTLQYGRH